MNPFSSLRGQGEQNHTTSQESPTLVATILNLLRLVSLDTNLVSDLSQICVLCEFQLGDTLTSTYYELGVIAQQLREYEEARSNYHQALQIYIEHGNNYSQATV
ncbi:tetratricopeptide repeat protein, partial [Aetokthonos hydrillicola]|uniref:tetratricopeptide repeat protein n=1 Tax=Aetokthonos hydrillicola TaxID=1550245 RepID=UPI001ABB50BB